MDSKFVLNEDWPEKKERARKAFPDIWRDIDAALREHDEGEHALATNFIEKARNNFQLLPDEMKASDEAETTQSAITYGLLLTKKA